MKRKKAPQSLQMQWLKQVLGPIAFVIFGVVILLHLYSIKVFHNALQKSLENRLADITETVDSMGSMSKQEYILAYTNYLKTYEDNGIVEVQLISTDGQLLSSTYSFSIPRIIDSLDVQNAMSYQKNITFRGRNSETGERIMTVSTPIFCEGEIVGVIRVISSMTKTSSQIIWVTGILVGIAFTTFGIIALFNHLYIRQITNSVEKLTETAKKITDGSYGIQMKGTGEGEIRTLVDSLNQMSTKISENDRKQKDFVSAVSHELRTPLTAISGWSETLLEETPNQDMETKQGLEIILKESKRLSSIVEDLLTLNKIESGRITISTESMDLSEEVEEALFTYQERFKRDQIIVRYESLENCPEVMADPIRIKQVLTNLLDNAVKHGGKNKPIDVQIYRNGPMLCCSIRDYGLGIPQKDLPHVKEKFFKGNPKQQGSGIGLSVSDKIVTMHQGTLTLMNAEEKGAIATLSLPIVKGL